MHVISNGAKYIDLKRLKQQNTTHRDEFKGCKGVKQSCNRRPFPTASHCFKTQLSPVLIIHLKSSECTQFITEIIQSDYPTVVNNFPCALSPYTTIGPWATSPTFIYYIAE